MKRTWLWVVMTMMLPIALGGCDEYPIFTASEKINDADKNFEITRRIVLYNNTTGEYIITIVGRCNHNGLLGELEVTCRTGENKYKRHYLSLSGNSYIVEQIDSVGVSKYPYQVVFRQPIVPSKEQTQE